MCVLFGSIFDLRFRFGWWVNSWLCISISEFFLFSFDIINIHNYKDILSISIFYSISRCKFIHYSKKPMFQTIQMFGTLVFCFVFLFVCLVIIELHIKWHVWPFSGSKNINGSLTNYEKPSSSLVKKKYHHPFNQTKPKWIKERKEKKLGMIDISHKLFCCCCCCQQQQQQQQLQRN